MNSGDYNWREIFTESGLAVTPRGAGWELAAPAANGLPLYVGVSASWISGQAPLTQIPAGPAEIRADLYRSLLEINERHFYLTKFALDAEGRLLLASEMPVTENSRQLTAQLLRALSRYGGEYAAIFRAGGLLDPQQWARRAPRGPGYDFDEFLLSPDGLFAEYLRGVTPEGWGRLDRQPQGQCWRIGYKGRLKLFDQAFLKLSASWLTLEVTVLNEPVPAVLFAPAPVKAAFLRYLLRLNDEMHLAKFGLDEGGRLLLLLELPLDVLDFQLFLLALRTLGNCLEQYAQELELLAKPESNPRLAQLLTLPASRVHAA